MFLVERRHLARLKGHAAGFDRRRAGDWDALFEYADLVRADLRQFITRSTKRRRRDVHVHVPGATYTTSRRKLTAHILLHEMRHWAQIAYAARAANVEPPGEHDLFFCPVYD